MARKPVEQIPLSSQLRPVASTVDTYVRPAESSLRGLAEALSVTDKGLQTLLQTRDKKAEQDAELRGRAAFYAEGSEAFAKSLSDGTVPAQVSPFYVRGFKNAQGAAAGNTLRTKWQDAWDNWEDKDSDDPEAFNKFFGGFVSTSVGTEDPDVLRGVLPAVEALQANATTQYTQYRHDRTVEGSLTAHGALISGAVQTGVDDGLVSDKGADYPTIFGNVDKVVAESLAKGDPGGKAVNTFIDVMSAKVLETKDPSLLKWFDRKVPGKDYTYGQTPHGLEVKNATVNSLETLARQQAAGLSAAERQAMDKAKDEAQSGIINGLLQDPKAPVDEKLLIQAERNGDPLIRLHAKQWKDDLLKGTSNPQDVTAFYNEVVSGRKLPKVALKEALSAGVFGTAEDMRAAVSFVQSYETSSDAIQKTLDGRVITSLLGTIKDRTSSAEDLMNPITGLTDEALEAQADLRQLVTRWIINNPNATQPEIDEQSVKFGKQILDRMTNADIGSSAKYNRDPNLPFSNPYDDTSKPGDQEQQGSDDPEVRAWEKSQNVTPDQRRAIEQQALKEGKGYEEFVHEKALKPEPISYSPDSDHGDGDRSARGITPEQASGYIDQAFAQAQRDGMTDDDRTGALLDLIGQGESDGNYNAVFGNPGNARDLSQYSVNDIIGIQQEARRRGIASTAIGKFGFIHKTLRGLKAEMGLTGDEKFTPQLQDKMGVALLNRRGLQAYKAGRISKKTFALSLSQEFAALPSPVTGRSYYHGDGLNRSRVSRQAVYSALGFQPIAYAPATGSTDAFDDFPLKGSPKGTGRGKLTFNHPHQEAGIQPRLRSAVEEVGQEMGRDFTVLSGYRSPNHKAERGKKSGGGEHTHGNAMDLDMAGMGDAERYQLVQALMAKGVKRFITYSKYPNMLHIDLKDQRGDGSAYFMHDKSAKNIRRAPAWLRALAQGNTV